MRCDCCGKFRKAEDLVYIEDTDGDGWVTSYSGYECKDCMSEFDRERYFPTQIQPSE